MSELTLQTWQTLHCLGCDSTSFVQLMELRVKPGGGSTTSQLGWQCGQCGQKADMPGMQRKLTVAQRRRELADLEAELERDDPPKPAQSTGFREPSFPRG